MQGLCRHCICRCSIVGVVVLTCNGQCSTLSTLYRGIINCLLSFIAIGEDTRGQIYDLSIFPHTYPAIRSIILFCRPRRRLLQNRLHHFIAQLGSLGESRREILLDPLEPVTIRLKVSKRNTVRPCLYRSDHDVSPDLLH